MRAIGHSFFYCLLFLLFFASQAVAQKIKYDKGTFEQVLAKAKKENKPIFLFMDMPPLPPSSIYYNGKKADTGLEDSAVAKAYNAQFISLSIAYTSAEGAMLRKKFAVTQFPMHLYLNPDGHLIHRSFGNSIASAKYLNDLKIFRKEASGTNNLSYFAEEYQKGKRSPDFLLQYIQLYRKMKLAPSHDLVDTYASSLPLHAFDTFSTVQFILELGPVVDSKAFRLSRSNKKVLDSLYATLPLAQRIKINNGIIQNTLQLAKDTHDKGMALKSATFARSTYNSKTVGQKAYQAQMMNFYHGINDTTNYLAEAATYYEHYYMALPIDSVKKIVAREQATIKARMASAAASQKTAPINPASGNKVYTERFATVGPSPASDHLNNLNNAAYSFFLTGTTHVPYLSKALAWSKRTVELAPYAAGYHDTMAHLLYRLQLYPEAEAAQKKAIDLAKQTKEPIEDLTQSLQKMRARTL